MADSCNGDTWRQKLRFEMPLYKLYILKGFSLICSVQSIYFVR
jgi:hypothetical protein